MDKKQPSLQVSLLPLRRLIRPLHQPTAFAEELAARSYSLVWAPTKA